MKFSYELVNECVYKLEKSLNNIKSIHDDCENNISSIKNNDIWEGPAARNYICKGKKIIQSCRKTEESILSIINYIEVCSENYKATENEIIDKGSSF